MSLADLPRAMAMCPNCRAEVAVTLWAGKPKIGRHQSEGQPCEASGWLVENDEWRL